MNKEQILALALFHARDYLTFKLGGRKGCDIEEIVCDDEIYAEIVNELASKFESFYNEAIFFSRSRCGRKCYARFSER